jgi:hypothetical protein
MQSNKTSKKTRTNANESSALPPEKVNPSEAAAKPRTSKSSKPKSETGETATVKMHRKATSIATQIDAAVEALAPKVEAVASKMEAVISKIETPVLAKSAAAGVSSTPNPLELAPSSMVTRERVAELAHAYWLARGDDYGSPEEDWLRAERELRLGH